MVVTSILSGGRELTGIYQAKALADATQDLSNLGNDLILVLDSGQKITISKVREGADYSTRLLAVTITD